MPNFDEIKINFSGGLVSQINNQITSSISDFGGLLLGRFKIIKRKNPQDKDENYESKALYLTIENVVFIYNSKYGNEKIEKLIQKIQSCNDYKDGIILGVMSGKSYSYPGGSLKEQRFYLKAYHYIRHEGRDHSLYNQGINESINNSNPNINSMKGDCKDMAIPFGFAAFAHNKKTEVIPGNSNQMSNIGINSGNKIQNERQEKMNTIRMITFNSKIFYLDNDSKFKSIPYETMNMKETIYNNTGTNPIAGKIEGFELGESVNVLINTLNESIKLQLDLIDKEHASEGATIKNELKKEMNEYMRLNNSFQDGGK